LTVSDSHDIFSEIDPNRRRIHMTTTLRERNSQTGIRSQTLENRFRTLDIEAVVIAPQHVDVVRIRSNNRNVLPVMGSVLSFCNRTIDSCVVVGAGALCSAD
jgi:hypothetical protein